MTRRRLSTALAAMTAVAVVLTSPLPGTAAASADLPACGPSRAPADQPTIGNSPPPAARAYFAKDFPQIQDSRLDVPVGGFGGLHKHGRLTHTPVVFVHGNQADAQNWLSPMLQFQNLAGYSMQEMYAISYNGLGNAYAGAPTTPPTAPDQDYFAQHPDAFANGGHGAANEDEVPDVCRFLKAVLRYTGAAKVDIVAHSLGVTIVRKLMHDYPALALHVRVVVAIAGANHGTSVCRGGLETSYYGCNEIAPGTQWLARLNRGDESPPPTRWMTVYNGSAGDPLFDPPDEQSPRLAGADNRTYAGAYHNDLRVDVPEVDDYLAFLLRHGQAGGPTAKERRIARRLARHHPDGTAGELCGIKKLTGC